MIPTILETTRQLVIALRADPLSSARIKCEMPVSELLQLLDLQIKDMPASYTYVGSADARQMAEELRSRGWVVKSPNFP